MAGRCSVCGEYGHDKRAHREDTLDRVLNADGPCEYEECPVMWEALCRYCAKKLCVQCLPIHFCQERNIDMRLRMDPDLVFADRAFSGDVEDES